MPMRRLVPVPWGSSSRTRWRGAVGVFTSTARTTPLSISATRRPSMVTPCHALDSWPQPAQRAMPMFEHSRRLISRHMRMNTAQSLFPIQTGPMHATRHMLTTIRHFGSWSMISWPPKVSRPRRPNTQPLRLPAPDSRTPPLLSDSRRTMPSTPSSRWSPGPTISAKRGRRARIAYDHSRSPVRHCVL